ncbi:MAG: FAD-binding protein [Chloroflexi bacterium]|mgnify:CR=1 FL=1|nr:FAD-binding protein [Chloroflexota bacterium]
MNSVTEADVAKLIEIAGEENVSTRTADLDAHSIDESWFPPHPADVIVWPSSTEQVAAIVGYANQRKLPVVAWSGGSSLEGNPVPVVGGILLAMYRMKAILDIREQDLQVVVQPGIIYDDLNTALGKKGLFFPPAPGSADVATIGGMVANNSSGMRAVKYGVTRHYVLKLKVVLADGSVITVGSNAKKSASGYDLVSLFVGSEGTLGIVTEVTLRLMGLPEQTAAVVASFEAMEDATGVVYDAISGGLDPSAIEILDETTIAVTNQRQGLALREEPTLFVEFHGNEAAIEEQLEFLRELCEDHGCLAFDQATNTEARNKLWVARKEAHDSIKESHPGKTMISGDVCVPMSCFGEMVHFVHQVSERTGLIIYVFGHAGDGNLHTEAIVDRQVEGEYELGLAATDEIVNHALEVGGTASGEHGVGLGKRQFMLTEHGDSLAVMRIIKQTLDPNGILNPGKIFPDSLGA